MRRTFGWLPVTAALALAGVLSAGGCKKEGGSSGSSSSTSGPIVVGEYGSMTGSEATFGISTDNGVKLAVKERNAAGGVKGRQVKLIAYDDKGSQQEAATAVTRLIQQDKVVAIVGEVASSLSIAGGQVAQRNGVPMVSPSSTNPKVTEVGDMVSRVCFIDPFQGWVDAKFAYDKLKARRAGVLFNRAQAYSVGLKDYFVKAFEQMGGQVVAQEAYGNGDDNFSAQLGAIGKNVDVIFVPGYYTEVVLIARQARAKGITAPLTGGDGWVSEALKNAGDALNGCYFSDHFAREDARPEVQAFLKSYKAEYGGQAPDSMAALGYDAANMLFDAMERAPSLKGKDLAAAINSTKGFKGVAGVITMDANRNARKPAVIQKVTDGTFALDSIIEPPTE